ncbi:polyprotein [Pansavirus 2]|uniref:polyprotein n=1 Tax=Pansavirus 2 TaxID=2016468 RepID=UPI000B5C1871|nr:polyprotein [Pansavirus 2]ASH99194.1 polyprotein [Pansavirus 2]
MVIPPPPGFANWSPPTLWTTLVTSCGLPPPNTSILLFQGFLRGQMAQRVAFYQALTGKKDVRDVWSKISQVPWHARLQRVRNRDLRLFLNYLMFLFPSFDLSVWYENYGDPDGYVLKDYNWLGHITADTATCPACTVDVANHFYYIKNLILTFDEHLVARTPLTTIDRIDQLAAMEENLDRSAPPFGCVIENEMVAQGANYDSCDPSVDPTPRTSGETPSETDLEFHELDDRVMELIERLRRLREVDDVPDLVDPVEQDQYAWGFMDEDESYAPVEFTTFAESGLEQMYFDTSERVANWFGEHPQVYGWTLLYHPDYPQIALSDFVRYPLWKLSPEPEMSEMVAQGDLTKSHELETVPLDRTVLLWIHPLRPRPEMLSRPLTDIQKKARDIRPDYPEHPLSIDPRMKDIIGRMIDAGEFSSVRVVGDEIRMPSVVNVRQAHLLTLPHSLKVPIMQFDDDEPDFYRVDDPFLLVEDQDSPIWFPNTVEFSKLIWSFRSPQQQTWRTIDEFENDCANLDVLMVKNFFHDSLSCPRFSLAAQMQRRCTMDHVHGRSGCVYAKMSNHHHCSVHRIDHAREWMVFMRRMVFASYNIDHKSCARLVRALYGTPIMVSLLKSPPRLLKEGVADLHRVYVPSFAAQGVSKGFKAQGAAMPSGGILGIFTSIKDTTINTAAALWDKIHYILDCLKNTIMSVLTNSGSTLAGWFASAMDAIIKPVFEKIFDVSILVGVWTAEHAMAVGAALEIIVLMLLVHFGCMTWTTAQAFTGLTFGTVAMARAFTGQDSSPLATVMTILVGAFYFLKPHSINAIRDRLTHLSLVLTTAGIASSVLDLVYFLLPEGLRLAIKYTFGGANALLSEQITQWRSTVVALNKLSTTSDVLMSPQYKQFVAKELATGLRLLRDSSGSDRASVMTMIPNLMRLDSIMFRFQNSSRDRPIPFTLHVAGPPGVGKTLLVRALLTHLGRSPSDVYFRPNHSEFWDGYNGQKVIIYDEFLVGDVRSEMLATEYLQLSSSAHFQVPAASLNDPTVGIKGEYCRPEIVITISNHEYPVAPHIDTDALHRRRVEVLALRFAKDAKLIGDNTVDLKAYDLGEIANAPWLECYVLPPQFSGELNEIPRSKGMRFRKYLEHLNLVYSQHLEVMEKLIASNLVLSDHDNPADLLHKALAEMEGIPTTPVNLWTYLGRMTGFVSQGRRNPARPVPPENMVVLDDIDSLPELPPELCMWRPPPTPTYHDMVALEIEERPWWKKVITGLGFAGVTIGIYLLGRAIISRFTDGDPPVQFIQQASGEPRSKKTKAKRKKGRWERFEDAMSEAPLFNVEIIIDGHRFIAIPLKERWIMTYYHGIQRNIKPAPVKNVVLMTNGTSYPATIVWKDMLVDSDNDMVIMELESPKAPMFPNLINKMLSSEEVVMFSEAPVTITTIRNNLPQYLMATCTVAHNRTYVAEHQQIVLEDALVYQADTQPGDCGSMITVRSGPFAGRLVGMHVAGRTDMSGLNYGMAVLLTKEHVLEAFNREHLPVPEGDFVSQAMIGEVVSIPPEQQVFLPRSSRLEPSALSVYLPPPVRGPAILEETDPRNKSRVDPVINYIHRLTFIPPKPDPVILDSVRAAMIATYKKMGSTFPERVLTLDEAVQGIPGRLSSIDLDTSPGIPLVYHRDHNKRAFVNIVGADLIKREGFEEMIASAEKDILSGKGHSHWIGYLKDELVKPSKIAEARTRVIYCGDFTAYVVFRRWFGSLVININEAWPTIAPTIGANPTSFDMNAIYNYLIEAGHNFLAGDYKNFDNNQHPAFRDIAYDVIGILAQTRIKGLPKNAWSAFVRHQTSGYVQINNIGFYQNYGHFSGCFFTSLVNCLVNEAYMRYAFTFLRPALPFDRHVRMKTLGDDHLVAFSDEAAMTFDEISRAMATLGQVYTSDLKEEKGTIQTDFSKVTFLGTSPVMFNGQWVGALKKDILEEAPKWTRDKNQSLSMIVYIMCEFASMHGNEYYLHFTDDLRSACEQAQVPFLEPPDPATARLNVANRTTRSGLTFEAQDPLRGYIAQGDIQPASEVPPEPDSENPPGLTDTGRPALQVSAHTRPMPWHHTMEAEVVSLQSAAESKIYRGSVSWPTSAARGTVLKSFTAPMGLLSMESSTNVQNMAFQNYTFWRGSCVLHVSINGNPFQQGLLCVYFYPLSEKGDSLPIENWPCTTHVFLRPGFSNNVELSIPYRYPTDFLRLAPQGNHTQRDLGTFVIGVYSPLSNAESESVTVTFYSSFPGSRFHTPKTRSWRAQGQGHSTVNQNYYYDIRDIAGSVGIEAASDASGMTQSNELDMPLDNPPIASGMVPTAPVFAGMSKTVGLEPTVSMELHPVAMDRFHKNCFNPEELTTKWTLGLPFLLTRFDWTTTDQSGVEKAVVKLDSALGQSFGDAHRQIPAPVALLNMFLFWHSDIEVTIKAIKTPYHSGRLRATMSYAHAVDSYDESTSYYNQVLDFSDGDEAKVNIPYLANTEFRRTRDGALNVLPDYFDKYGIGDLTFYVVNPLRCLSLAVSTSIDVLVFARLTNPVVACPRPFPAVTGGQFSATITTPSDFVAQGRMVDLPPEPDSHPDRLVLGQKFEYRVANLLDLARRMVPIHLSDQASGGVSANVESSYVGVPPHVYSFRVYPASPLSLFYAAWAGSLRYRIFVPSSEKIFNPVTFTPVPLWITGHKSYPTVDYGAVNHAGAITISGASPLSRLETSGVFGSLLGAHEILAPVASGKDWIDIMVPFFSTYNFLAFPLIRNSTVWASCTESSPGSISFGYTDPTFRVYQAVGDDFDFGIFRPPLDIHWLDSTGLILQGNYSVSVGGLIF